MAVNSVTNHSEPTGPPQSTRRFEVAMIEVLLVIAVIAMIGFNLVMTDRPFHSENDGFAPDDTE